MSDLLQRGWARYGDQTGSVIFWANLFLTFFLYISGTRTWKSKASAEKKVDTYWSIVGRLM